MAIILSLETSGNSCSVALHNNGQLVAIKRVDEPQAHASKLAPLIQAAANEANVLMMQLEAVAITAGPGSYTGLRIGTSTAKGLCFSLNIPLISVSTLDLLVYQGIEFDLKCDLLCPMIDARRMEVYCMIADRNFKVIQPTEASILDENSFASLLEHNTITFYGDGAAKFKSVLQNSNAFFVDDVLPSVEVLGNVAQQKFSNKQFEDLIYFEPNYLKEFQVKKSTKPMFGFTSL